MANSASSGYYNQNKGKAILRAECRVCLKKDGILPIFGDETKPDISMEIEMFGGVQLNENDDFPKFICQDCFKLLESAISFRRCCKRTDALLKRRKKKCEVFQFQEGTVVKTESVNFKIELLNQPTYQLVDHANQSDTNNVEFVEDIICTDSVDRQLDFVSVDVAEPSAPMGSYVKHEEAIVVNKDEHDDTQNNDDSDEEPLKKSNRKKHEISCKYCNLSFKTLQLMEEHRLTVEHKRNYVMSFLPKKKKAQSNAKDFFCEICGRSFTKIRYTKHMLMEHNVATEPSNNPVKKECTICNKMLHPAALKAHVKKIHNQEKDLKPKVKLECPICKKLFSKHFYPLHMQRHKQGDTRNYVCDQCGKKFFFKSSFFTHRLIHSNDLPHKCEYCPYRGRTKELLKIHVRTHTGDYPYKCNQCDAKCLTKSNLNSHMRRHRGPIDFICDACNRGFYSKIQLERHISVTHYGVKNHICSICGAAFGYRHGLTNHQRKVHKRPKGLGKPKAVYLQLEERGLLQPEQEM